MAINVQDYPNIANQLALVAVKPDGEPCLVLCDADGRLDVGLTFDGTVNVGEVSFDQTTPGTTNGVVVNSSALPTGAATQTTLAAVLAKIIAAPATEAKQDTGNSTLSTINGKLTACNTGAVTVAASALPTGAATAAKQPALGTAGSASADVITVQGIANGMAQPVSGTVTANTATASLANSTAYEASRVVKASAGTLLSLTGYNSGPAQFIQLYNSTTLPANGVAPSLVVAVPATSTFAFEWRNGIPLSTGIVVGNSSTAPTKTIGSADCYFTATFI